MTASTHGGVRLDVGDKTPGFYGMRADGGFHSSEAQIGRPAALILADGDPSDISPLITAFARRAAALSRFGVDALVLAPADPRWAAIEPPTPGPALLLCPAAHAFATAVGDAHGRPLVLVVDRNLRIVARLEGEAEDLIAEQAVAALSALPRPVERIIAAPAPVLIVPNLIDAGLCQALIDRFEAGPHTEGAMASVDAQGRAVRRIDADKKHRRDLELTPEAPLHVRLLEALDRRLLPEIRRAFQVEVAHVDRLLIARYDDTGGWFRRHRDDTAPSVAFRQFALSLNLNAEAYEGGALRFPEFSDDLYSPPTGAACVFSASLLHEATPVTRGRRYVLLTFLHDDAAETRRQACLAANAAAEAA